MNKQDLRYSYLGYIAGQYAKKEDIDFDTLEDMAAGDNDLEREVLKDLINEGLLEGIEVYEDEHHSKITQYKGELKLTTKGIKEILNLFPDEKKEIIDDIKSDIENQKHKVVSLEDIINKENERISKLSKKEKVKEIKEKILLLFWDYNINIHNYNEGKILHSEIKSKIRKIVQHYYDGAISTLSKEAINELRLEDYIKYRYEDKNSEIQINTLLTPKGIAHIKNEKAKKEFELKDYIEKNNIKIPNEVFKIQNILTDIYAKTNTEQLQAAAEVMQNSGIQAVMKALENAPINHIMQNINKYYSPLYNESFLSNYDKLVNSINNSAKAISNNLNPDKKSLTDLIKEPSSNLYKELTKESKDPELFTFEGILGLNCGNYIKVDDKNIDDRLPERIINEKTGKHFIVKNGIKVLRGFAKASDLYNASEPDKKNYQRNEDPQHLKEIKTFLSEINPSGKYLPELTFVARGGYELIRPEWGNSLKTTNLGHFKNLDYYQLNLNGTKLYRIDGNHRLEALKRLSNENKEYYIPFAIILMGKQIIFDSTDEIESSNGLEYSGNYGLADDTEEKKITDMEAFLFYFLNAKAKKLTTEENYKGLIDSEWKEHEIELANKNIILLQQLKEILNLNILHSYFCNNEPLKQITEILDKINENISINDFKEIIRRMNNLLAKDIWPTLRDSFNFYCQLVFYIAYKHSTEDECVVILNNLENWVKKYHFNNTTFENPILLYNNAEKTNNLRPINIFVAMAYDKTHIDNFTEWIGTAIKNIEEKKPKYSGRIHLNKIMTHRGYNIDLIDDIMQKIKECSIFIAEISSDQKTSGGKTSTCDANPNVMYELGIAHNLKKPIILMREEQEFPSVPSDIQEKFRNSYDRKNSKETREILEKSINAVIEDYYDL